MTPSGYYRFPAIFKDTVVFTSEDDLWTVPAAGGVARRLTSNLGAISSPYFSPDGLTIAFTGREEGHNEVYTIPADGGPVQRLTYLGVASNVIGWTPDGSSILFSSDFQQPIDRHGAIFGVSPKGGLPEALPIGLGLSISITTRNRTVIGRNNNDPARWKRYKGGTAGDIWIDAEGEGQFRRLVQLNGNIARPMWIGERVFYLSDHEGIANIYSTTPDGTELTQHTRHTDFFVRFPSTDGARIAYHAGADLYVYNPSTHVSNKIDVSYYSPRVYRQRRFVDASKYLESYTLSPKGEALAVTARGKSFTFGNWEGAVKQQSGAVTTPMRLRLTSWLNDGKRVVAVSDSGGEETLEIHSVSEISEPIRLEGLDIGKPNGIQVSPTQDAVVLRNHRNELILVDLEEKSLQLIDRSPFGGIQGFDWSPDGAWGRPWLPRY